MAEVGRRTAWHVALLTIVGPVSIASVLAAPAQTPRRVSSDGVWRVLDTVPDALQNAERSLQPTRYRLCELHSASLRTVLQRAPHERVMHVADSPQKILVPMPDGSFAPFRIVESPIMAPELAAKYPEIRTYLGVGLNDPPSPARFDWTPHGFHAQILSAAGAIYVDPYLKNNNTIHVAYYKRDYPNNKGGFQCLTHAPPREGGAAVAASSPPVGDTLRTYRLACAATGEYTQFHGGTKALGLAAIVTAVNRVTGIYENDVAVRMELVPNNDDIVYTNGGTDPYSNNNGGAMLSQNQSNLTTQIGSANYDIGHVFSTGGGGVASLGVVCSSSSKARGVTGLFSPINDPFYVDYVAHEMGHQFGANHSFNGVNGSCCCGNRNGSTAYEPGSGATIMAYAGICGADNLQSNSDAYFHSISVDEITNFVISGNGRFCDAPTATGNDAPSVDAGPAYTIPKSTPFALVASGSDPNGDALTYTWEERDLGPAVSLATPDQGSIPLFRSFSPVSSRVRFFPRLSVLLNNLSVNDEKLPTTNRTMRFRVTARDDQPGGGGINWDETLITVDASAGPFVVTSPNTAVAWEGTQTVTWNVAGTDGGSVNVALVDILLSTDGGITYPHTLAFNTPNDGSETVEIPDVDTPTARIKVAAVNNVFSDISDVSFTIGPCSLAAAPLPDNAGFITNRYLSFVPSNAGQDTALRITFVDLPGAYAGWNSAKLWVGQPRNVSEIASLGNSTPPTFVAAELGCEPYITDWSAYSIVHVYHEGVVPDGTYEIQAVDSLCGTTTETAFSPALELSTGIWGDVCGAFDLATGWSAPDANRDLVNDVIAVFEKFIGNPSAPAKVRVDVEPAEPDQLINIDDAIQVLDAFRGINYTFAPTGDPCP